MGARSPSGRLLGRYGSVLDMPGVRAPALAAFVGCVPIGMLGLGLLLLTRETSGSFAFAGRVAGAYGLAAGLGAVAQGRLADRLGQTRVIVPCAILHALSLALLVATAEGANPLVLPVCAAVAGLTRPQLLACLRALWPALVPDQDLRGAAYALQSLSLEVAMIAGPLLVAGLVAIHSPVAAVLAAAALSGGALAFAATTASRRWRGRHREPGRPGALCSPGVRALFTSILAADVAVRLVLVAVPVFAAARGAPSAAGLLLAALSSGSLLGGLLYGACSWPLPRSVHVAALEAVFALGAVLAAAAGGLPQLLPVLAPLGIAGSALLDEISPPGTITEAYGLLVAASAGGSALGVALGGHLVQVAGGARSAFLLAAACAGAGTVLAAARLYPAGRAPSVGPASPCACAVGRGPGRCSPTSLRARPTWSIVSRPPPCRRANQRRPRLAAVRGVGVLGCGQGAETAATACRRCLSGRRPPSSGAAS